MTRTQKYLHLMGGASVLVMTAVAMSGQAMAQDTAAPASQADSTVVVVTGQRAALRSAQKIKKDADEVVDSVVADDIGKLPDRSVTEVLQRIPGISIDHNFDKADPEHYSVEGSGVNVRGLTFVRSELNGRDSFSANGGRALNFEDVPPELMSGVDVYKNPSAEQIEGAIGGLVNLRTFMPFDFKGPKAAVSLQGTYSELLKGKADPSASVLVSDRWDTGAGEFGALVDIAYSEADDRTDAFQVEPYYPRSDIVAGKTVYIPKGAQWRTLLFNRKRLGTYGALQWRPNEDVSTSLTYFNSHYQMKWDEQALFAGENAYNIHVQDGEYDDQGALVKGRLTIPGTGFNFGNDTRTATRVSDTTDVSWNLSWDISSKLNLKTDLQYVRSGTHQLDSTVATAIQMPYVDMDLTGSLPRITTDATYAKDPDNYYWGFHMEHLDKSIAHEWAWRTDLKYEFESSVLKDLRVGVRLTDRDSTNTTSVPSYNWAPISQPWMVGWDISGLAYLGDPRFGGDTHVDTFSNFFNGRSNNVPALVFPDVSWATGYPGSYSKLDGYYQTLCAEAHGGSTTGCAFHYAPATLSNVNQQDEKSRAVYSQLRFNFDSLKWPIDGNVGVRYVVYDITSTGSIDFTRSVPATGAVLSGLTLPDFTNLTGATGTTAHLDNIAVSRQEGFTLPSLNLRMKVNPTLQFRFAIAKAITPPDFSQLQASTSLTAGFNATSVISGTPPVNHITVDSLNLTGSGAGNPYLKPTEGTQIDLTAEWYFSPVGSLTLALFHKDLDNIIVNQVSSYPLTDKSGTTYDFNVISPTNGKKGKVNGFEVAYQQYFDKLPGWLSGFGVQANFTYVDSHTTLKDNSFNAAYCHSSSGGTDNVNGHLNGCDTDGRSFGNLPLDWLSKYAYNLNLLYDKGPVSARLAYNWRSKYLQGLYVNGTTGGDGLDTDPSSATLGQHNVAWGLPTYMGDTGQLDASLFYKVTDKLTLGFEAQNVTDAVTKQLMQQHIGFKTRAWFVSGPRYTMQLRYAF